MQSKKQINIYPFIFLFSLVFLFTSCKNSRQWGLIIWDNDENALPVGSVLPIFIKSNLNQVWVVGPPVFLVQPDNTDGEKLKPSGRKKEKYEVPLWQLEAYPSRAKAEEQARLLASYARTYGETLQDGLPIRERPENTADTVYRLRQNQVVKVLYEVKGAEVSSGGKPLPGKWLRIMTGDGTKGYTFSYRLRLFEKALPDQMGNGEAVNLDDKLKRDFSTMLSINWYPLAYKTMYEHSQIDLERISLQEGLSFNEATSSLSLAYEGEHYGHQWQTVSTDMAGTWHFDSGRIQIVSLGENIELVWPELFKGPIGLATLPLPINDIIKTERERRKQLLDAVWRRGPNLSSKAVGKLQLKSGYSFSWSGFDALVPEILPTGLSGNGSAESCLFFDPDLRSPYTGALRFNFDLDNNRRYSADFFYAFEIDGIRLQYIPPQNIDGLVIKKRDASAPSIYFTRALD